VLVRYEIVQKLGRGAYGIVWKAIDKKTREALKRVGVWSCINIKMDVEASQVSS